MAGFGLEKCAYFVIFLKIMEKIVLQWYKVCKNDAKTWFNSIRNINPKSRLGRRESSNDGIVRKILMKGTYIKILTGLLICLLFSGCGQKTEQPEEDLQEYITLRAGAAEILNDMQIYQGMEETEAEADEQAGEEQKQREQAQKEREYQARFDAIERIEDIEANDYEIMEEQIFPVVVESCGTEECTFFPAMEKNYNRLAIFLADGEGNIFFKTNQLETNNRIPGQLKQVTRNLSAVTFSDLNRDGRTDIVLITKCVNDRGEYAGKPYKVGDVLFQGDKTFYRDWRISDKINRFDMNRSVNSIIAFVKNGRSTEFLYTATTLDELLKNGFTIIEEQDYARRFEKLGKLQVVPGTFRISEYDIFMIYLVDEKGDIVWSFQPMGSYDNLYTLRGITGKDVDGDGMKDLVVLARYTYEGENGELLIQTECAIYYQRTGGFDIDTEFSRKYKCNEEDTMEALIPKIRAYWGWQVEETEETAEGGEEEN